jgi:hypothetical protein
MTLRLKRLLKYYFPYSLGNQWSRLEKNILKRPLQAVSWYKSNCIILSLVWPLRAWLPGPGRYCFYQKNSKLIIVIFSWEHNIFRYKFQFKILSSRKKYLKKLRCINRTILSMAISLYCPLAFIWALKKWAAS